MISQEMQTTRVLKAGTGIGHRTRPHSSRLRGGKPTANAYAPTMFAKEAAAKTQHIRKSDLEAAMRRLFEASKIHVANYGRPSRPASMIAAGAAPLR
jgi:hypothetical protein